jgi:hypothetical protein
MFRGKVMDGRRVAAKGSSSCLIRGFRPQVVHLDCTEGPFGSRPAVFVGTPQLIQGLSRIRRM